MEQNMDRVMILDHNIKNIGLATRTVTEGEEQDLVKSFIDYYIHIFLKNNKVNNLAVFIEPQVASGFPDIVFASYSTRIMDNWSKERDRLDISDFKVLSYLIMSGGCSGDNLIGWLGMDEKVILETLEKLLDAKMVCCSKGVWKPVDLKKIYHIKKLVSVEAKMSDIRKKLTPFSSHA